MRKSSTSKILLLAGIVLLPLSLNASAPVTHNQRFCIMIFDPENNVNSSSDAMITTLLMALKDACAPIIVSNSVWNTYAATRALFFAKIQSDLDNYREILAAQNKLKQLLEEHEKPIQWDEFRTSLKKFSTSHADLHNKLHQLYCYRYPANIADWSIFASKYFHILIPKDYEQKLERQSYTLPQNIQIQSKVQDYKELYRNLSHRELILGLKIENKELFTPVQTTNQYILPPTKLVIKDTYAQSIEAIESLKTIFIGTHDTIIIDKHPVANKDQSGYLHPWILYVTGHGSPMQQPQKIEELIHSINITNTALETLEQTKKDEHKDYWAKKNKLIEHRYHLTNELEMLTGNLIGLNLEAFKYFLSFLNTNIKTSYLVYKTCYGAGPASIIPYLPLKGPAVAIYNFTIVAGASSDIATGTSYDLSLSYIPHDFHRAQYEHTHNRFAALFNGLAQHPAPQSIQFSSTLNTVLKFQEKILDNDPEIIIRASNIPLVRPAGTDHFFIIHSERIFPLTAQLLQSTKENIFIDDKDVLLLYTHNIPVTLTIFAKSSLHEFPIILSMIPGNATHTIKEINARQSYLGDIVEAFSHSLYRLASHKRYKIDKLLCCNDLATEQTALLKAPADGIIELHNIVIENNPPDLPQKPDETIFLLRFEYNNAIFRAIIHLNDADKNACIKSNGNTIIKNLQKVAILN